jgi:hypothetical protein
VWPLLRLLAGVGVVDLGDRRRRPAAGRWRGDPRPFWSPFLGLQQRKR